MAGLCEAQITKTVATGYDVDIKLDAADQDSVIMTFTLKKGSWMGLGLGTSRMTANNDFFQVDSDNKSVHDMTSTAYNSLDEDA